MSIEINRKVILIPALAGGASMLFAVALSANPVAGLNKQVKNANFQAVNPIVNGIKPGMLYMDTDAAGGAARTILCEDLFANHKPVVSNAVLANLAINNSREAKASLSLLPGLFKAEANAEASLRNAGVEKGTLSFGKPEIAGLQALVSATGTKREVSKPCMETVSGFFNSDGKTDRKIFLVAQTLSADEINYDFNIKKEKSAGLQAALTNIFGIGFGYKKDTDTTAKISFKAAKPSDRMIVGIRSVRIKNLKRDTMVDDDLLASVTGDAVPATDTPLSFKPVSGQ